MPDINEAFKQIWGKEVLENLAIPLNAEEIAQRPEGITLKVLL